MSTYVTLNSKMPEVAVDIDFANNPTSSTRTWTSVSTRLREIAVRLYRSNELDDFQVGSMSLVLDNRDRALEPLFSASAFSPNVVPRRPIRYRARWTSSFLVSGLVSDDFGDGVIGAQWTQTNDPDVAMSETGGQLQFVCNGNDGISSVKSSGTQDMRNAQTSVKLHTTVSTPNLYMLLYVLDDSNNYVRIAWGQDLLFAEHKIGGVLTQLRVTTSAAPTHFRLREAGGMVSYEYSTDGGTQWLTYWMEPTPISLASVEVRLEVQRIGAGGSGTVRFDDFVVEAAEFERFWGFTTSHGIQWPALRDAVTVLEAADIGLLLNRDQVLLNGYPEETASARINRVLDDIGVPTGVRLIDSSDALVAAVPALVGTEQASVVGALQHCQDCARSDGGYFYIARNGTLTFHNRRHRKDILGSPSITFGDVSPPAAGEIPYTPDLVGSVSDARLWNQATVIAADGTREEYENTTSSTRYWRSRRDDYQSLLVKPGDAAARATLYVWRYSQDEPALAFPHINAQMVNRTGMDMPALLAADVGTRSRIKRRPPGGGTLIDEEAHVEGITETVTVHGPMYSIGFDVSPADPAIDEWVLGTDTLGSTAIVGY